MNPSNNNTGMELPPPIEQLPVPGNSSESSDSSQEKPAQPSFEASTNPAFTPPPIPLPSVSLPVASDSNSTATVQSDDNQSTSAQATDDKDLIEKEWVNKAKAIVERDREDPYKQSEDLTLLKADYMKKQFNKTLKLNK